VALDEANEMSFPASDPVNTSNITRITKAPVLPEAAADHQNSNKIKTAAKKPPISKTVYQSTSGVRPASKCVAEIDADFSRHIVWFFQRYLIVYV